MADSSHNGVSSGRGQSSGRSAHSTVSPGAAPPSAGLRTGASIDELKTRLRGTGEVSDDIASMIAENWSRVLGGVLLLVLIVWVSHFYRNVQQTKKAEAASQFAGVQQIYASAVLPEQSVAKPGEPPPSPKSAEERAQAVGSMESVLQLLHTRDPDSYYGKSAELYRAASLLAKGDSGAARERLKQFDTGKFFSPGRVRPLSEVERHELTDEIAALLEIRADIAAGAVPLPEVRTRLINLANGTRFLCGEALIAAASLAGTPEEKDAVAKAARDIFAVRPEFRAGVAPEFARLGIELDPDAEG